MIDCRFIRAARLRGVLYILLYAWLTLAAMHEARGQGIQFQPINLADTTPGQDLWRYDFALTGLNFNLGEGFTLFFDPVTLRDITISDPAKDVLLNTAPAGKKIATLDGDAIELRITIARAQAERKLFGFTLFADGKGGGLSILFRPETGTLRLGTTEAPFAFADLPQGADVELRIFIDKYLVEVFANDRQALLTEHGDYRGRPDLHAFSIGAPLTLKQVEIWKLKPTHQGFREAQTNRDWEPATK